MDIGNRYTYSLRTIADSSTAISLHPNWAYKEKEVINRKQLRTQGGQLNQYTLLTSVIMFDLPLNFIDQYDASDINGWWRDGTELYLNINTDVNPVYTDYEEWKDLKVKIFNVQRPFKQLQSSQFTKYQGLLTLKSVGSLLSPFILDDAYYGLLDQNYNGLT